MHGLHTHGLNLPLVPVVSVPLLVGERGEVGRDPGQVEVEEERDDGESGHHWRPGHG